MKLLLENWRKYVNETDDFGWDEFGFSDEERGESEGRPPHYEDLVGLERGDTFTIGNRKPVYRVVGALTDRGTAKGSQTKLVVIDGSAERKTYEIQKVFKHKRQIMLDGLREIGITFDREPGGSFYLWGNASDLPKGLNTGMDFLSAALKIKVIAVPGAFFDINPGKRMKKAGSRFENYLRFSYGPDTETIKTGLARLKEMVENW